MGLNRPLVDFNPSPRGQKCFLSCGVFLAAIPQLATGQKSNTKSRSAAVSTFKWYMYGACTDNNLQSKPLYLNSPLYHENITKLRNTKPVSCFFFPSYLFHSAQCVFVTCFSHWLSPPNKHGVITTEDEQYLIEPLKNISATTSGEWNLEEAQQHVIYKMSAIPSPQEHSQEFSCGISGWWTSIRALGSVWVELT